MIDHIVPEVEVLEANQDYVHIKLPYGIETSI